MTVVHGLKGDSRIELLEQRGSNSNIKIVEVSIWCKLHTVRVWVKEDRLA